MLAQNYSSAQPIRSGSELKDPAGGLCGLRSGSVQSERLLVSPLLQELGVRHGFTTRLSGVSTGRYESLNLGEKWGDEPDKVLANLRLVESEGGFLAAALCSVAQVHGTEVALIDAPERRQRQADGLATSLPLTLGVYSADCVCILLADGRGRVAAVHAGWRGTVAGIAGRAVQALVRLGAEPQELRAALGPSIGPCCFEVQNDVAAHFAERVPESLLQLLDNEGEQRTFVDLRLSNRRFLEAAGVPPESIADAPPCTHCDRRRFFSYRRDGAGIGQHLAFIVGGGS
jgi:YfiH family protein